MTRESWKQFMRRVDVLGLNSYAKEILLPETPRTTLQNLWRAVPFFAGYFFSFFWILELCCCCVEGLDHN